MLRQFAQDLPGKESRIMAGSSQYIPTASLTDVPISFVNNIIWVFTQIPDSILSALIRRRRLVWRRASGNDTSEKQETKNTESWKRELKVQQNRIVTKVRKRQMQFGEGGQRDEDALCLLGTHYVPERLPSSSADPQMPCQQAVQLHSEALRGAVPALRSLSFYKNIIKETLLGLNRVLTSFLKKCTNPKYHI